MFILSSRGSFKNINNFLKWGSQKNFSLDLKAIGERGIEHLSENTPRDTGLTSESWGYKVVPTARGYRLDWTNSNVADGALIAILIQYGHATGSGGYVPSVDYINPAVDILLDEFTRAIWKEIERA